MLYIWLGRVQFDRKKRNGRRGWGGGYVRWKHDRAFWQALLQGKSARVTGVFSGTGRAIALCFCAEGGRGGVFYKLKYIGPRMEPNAPSRVIR